MRDASSVLLRHTREHASFGGVVPSDAVARDDVAAIFALAVEHHRDGAAVPLLVLAQTPGLLTWNLDSGVTATDDLGTRYETTGISHHAGLGSLQVTAWLVPAVPPAARRLRLRLDGLRRISSPRGGFGIERDLPGDPRTLTIDLCPPRTRCAPPDEPGPDHGKATTTRTPSRGLVGFEGLLPVGQARIGRSGTACAWAVERYRDRAVLTMSLLHGEDGPGDRLDVRVWDDAGTAYATGMLHIASAPGHTEFAVALNPGIDRSATRLGIAVDRSDGDRAVMGVRCTPGASE